MTDMSSTEQSYMDKWSPEQANLLRLLSAVCGTGDMESVDLSAWDEIYEELRAQDVHCMLWPVLDDLKLEDGKMQLIRRDLGLGLRTFYTLMNEQDEVLKVLENAGITPVILKGAAAAVYYPDPDHRHMGDIDIIVPREQFNQAFEALKNAGYGNQQELNDLYRRHIGFVKGNGKEIELHRYFSSSEKSEQDKVLDGMIFAGIENRTIRDVCGYQVPMLPDFENGLVLLSHLNQHMLAGLGMRQIMDWYMYIDMCLGDDKWPAFKEIADKIGMTKLAMVAAYMCRKYFGFHSNITWCNEAANDDELADELMEYVFENGCMGKKMEQDDRVVDTTMVYLRNPIRGVRYLDKAGAIHLKQKGAPGVLRPFAAFYQIGHLASNLRKRKIKVTKVTGNLESSRNKVDFLKRLGVTRM